MILLATSKRPARTVTVPQIPTKMPIQKPTKVPPALIPDRIDGQPVSPVKLPGKPVKK